MLIVEEFGAAISDNIGNCDKMGNALEAWRMANFARYKELVAKHKKLPSELWSRYGAAKDNARHTSLCATTYKNPRVLKALRALASN